VDVVGLSSGVVAVGSGNSHTCALTSAGSIKCWGNNSFGQLGNGSRTSSTVPVDVIGLGGDAVALSVGTGHACALNRAGGVQCWGYNFAGGLGNGSFTDSDMPVGVTGLDAGVISVSAGGAFTCALTSAGSVKCWGPNGFGQLGNGSTADSAVPVDVTGLGSGVVAVSAGIFQTCAITSAGGLKCWGNNQYGGLGDGSTTNSTVPVDVTGLSSGVVAVDIGQYHSCAITSTGSAKCWGINGSGGLGNGNQTSSTVPVDATGLSGGVVALSIGDFYTCARYSAGGIKCVGSGQFGQLGSDTSPDTFSLVPLTVPGFP
jgi:alpha-tubulin suppressor-like RCC1 family protein